VTYPEASDPGAAALRVEALTVRFPGKPPVVAVNELSFTVAPGEIVGLLGANGAGKTTTLRAMSTLIRPSAGRVEVAGYDTRRAGKQARTAASLLLEGDRNLYWRLTPRQNLEYFAALQGYGPKRVRPVIDDLLERLDLTAKGDVSVRQLSRGMKQKLAVACTLVRQTPIILLDEPTLGLDVATSLELRTWLRELAGAGKTVVLSSHDMNVIEELCERVVILSEGKLVTDDLVENLIRLFGVDTYRIDLANPLGETAGQDIRSRFPAAAISPEHDSLVVEVDGSEGFYELVACLRAAGAVIASVRQEEVRLEQAFIRLVAGR
jgi:ABC-2 type transport system ATP-binding protein